MAYHYRWIIRPKTKGPGFESFFTFICALSFYNFSSHRRKGGFNYWATWTFEILYN